MKDKTLAGIFAFIFFSVAYFIGHLLWWASRGFAITGQP